MLPHAFPAGPSDYGCLGRRKGGCFGTGVPRHNAAGTYVVRSMHSGCIPKPHTNSMMLNEKVMLLVCDSAQC